MIVSIVDADVLCLFRNLNGLRVTLDNSQLPGVVIGYKWDMRPVRQDLFPAGLQIAKELAQNVEGLHVFVSLGIAQGHIVEDLDLLLCVQPLLDLPDVEPRLVRRMASSNRAMPVSKS